MNEEELVAWTISVIASFYPVVNAPKVSRQWRSVVQKYEDEFANRNPQFDRVKFRQECGLG